MERRNGAGGDVAETSAHGEALEFVRFCHRRKRVGWPELYDEMCAVAGRGLYRGYGSEELADIGIGFTLFQMQSLATLVSRVVAEDLESRRRTAEAVRAATVVPAAPVDEPVVIATDVVVADGPIPTRTLPAPEPSDIRIGHAGVRIAAPAGA